MCRIPGPPRCEFARAGKRASLRIRRSAGTGAHPHPVPLSTHATVSVARTSRDVAAEILEVVMTTLDTLGTARPDRDEVADAALAMADFDAKGHDYATALDWLAVAVHHRPLNAEYADKQAAWGRRAETVRHE